MRIRDYHDGDLTWIRKRVDFLHGQTGMNDARLAALSCAWTITQDFYPVCVTGCFKLFENVWHCWMIVSDDVRGHGLAIVRRCRAILKLACEANHIKRLTANVDAGNEENLGFARLVGFEVEYIQLDAGPNASGDIAGMVYWFGGRDERRQTESPRDQLQRDVGPLQQLGPGRATPLDRGLLADPGQDGRQRSHARQ